MSTLERPVRQTSLIVAGILLLLFGLFLWKVKGILAPFVVAMIVAATLNPPMERLQAKGFPRLASVLIIYVVFFVTMGVFFTWLFPILVKEATMLGRSWPQYVDAVLDLWNRISQSRILDRIPVQAPADWNELTEQIIGGVKQGGQAVITGVLAGVVGTITFVINLVILLVSTFFFMMHWPAMRRRVQYTIPPQFRPSVLDVANRVSGVFLGFLRGQIYVCSLYGVTVVVLLLGLDLVPNINTSYPFLLGFVAAILYAIPYLGAWLLVGIVGAVTFVGSDYNFFSALIVTGVVLGINITVFDNVISPKILGSATGLNPLLSLFAIIAGSELFGIVGFILGVPVAASIAIIATALYPRLSERIPDDFAPQLDVAGGKHKRKTTLEKVAEAGLPGLGQENSGGPAPDSQPSDR